MDFNSPVGTKPTDPDSVVEVIESLECLLYLMGLGAVSPEQVRAFVTEAKKILWGHQTIH